MIRSGRQQSAARGLCSAAAFAALWGCSGSTGEPPRFLATVIAEAAGEQCQAGGSKVSYGRDTDNNGLLDDREVSEETPAALLPKLLQMYRHDPDPGLHGASAWLVTQWGRKDLLHAIYRQLAAFGDRHQH